MRAVLFDIDQTLLWSGGAGGLAMTQAFMHMFGIDNGFARVEFSGRTDRAIFLDALRRHGISGDEEPHLDEFARRYYALLPDALRQKQGCLMPGFPQLLDALSRRPDVRLGLATGNFSGGARLKLAHYAIDRFFPAGAFGEESEDRSQIVRLAIQRVADGARPQDILVVGDTPHDVSSALDNGVMAVGVATGKYTVEDLRRSGAQIVFQDFADWQDAAAALAGA